MQTFLRSGLRFARAMDRLGERVGGLMGWLALLMVLVGSYNAIVRYLGKYLGWTLSSNAYIELQWYLFSLIFLFGAAYTLQRDRHVRVDVLYGRLSRRGKDWIDLIGGLLLMLPFTVYVGWVAWPSVRNSWAVREISPDPGGLARYPIKAALLVAFALLTFQGAAELVKVVARLRGVELDDEPDGAGDGRPDGDEAEDHSGNHGFAGGGV